MPPQPLLSIRDLRVRFAIHGTTLDAVRGVSFDIPPGETVALVGESGSGKSVLARAIMGLLPENAAITSGQIILNNPKKDINALDITTLPPNGRVLQALRGGNISLIFQEPMVSLSALHTIGDQISEALFLHRQVNRREGMEITRQMLQTVGFTQAKRALKLYPFELSGGMRQRAMIAMALICHPALLIADEPTTALDVTIQAQILKLIKTLQSHLNMAVLMITHDLGVVANVAKEVVVMYHGEIMERGTVTQIFSAPRHEYTRALLKAVPHLGMPAGQRLTPLREIKSDAARYQKMQQTNAPAPTPKTQPPSESRPPPPTILQVQNLSKSFTVRSSAWTLPGRKTPDTQIHAVQNVSFTMQRGECLGLVGESGSGKSTLGKMIAHAILPDRGTIHYTTRAYQNHQVATMDEAQLFNYRCKVQYIFQDPVGSLNPTMTLFDIIREPMQIHNLGNRDYQIEMCRELLRLVGLDPRHLRRYPHSFSGGQRQRIGIARALALSPELLICDEPVSALDVSIQAQVLNLMKDLQRELGLSYLFISHNLAVVDYIATRIAVMYRGRLVELAPRESLFQRPTHPYTKTLLRAIPIADLNQPLDFTQIPDPTTDINPDEIDQIGDPTTPSPDQFYEVAPGHLVRTHA